MNRKGLFLGFSALCDFLPNTFVKKKFPKRFQKLLLKYFWALDVAPTWAVPGLLLFLQSRNNIEIWKFYFFPVKFLYLLKNSDILLGSDYKREN